MVTQAHCQGGQTKYGKHPLETTFHCTDSLKGYQLPTEKLVRHFEDSDLIPIVKIWKAIVQWVFQCVKLSVSTISWKT